MTELVPQKTSALEGADLETVLKSLTSSKVASAPEKPVAAAKVVPVPDTTIEAIKRLNDRLTSTKLPSERRRLTETEQANLVALGSDAKLIEKTIKTAVQAVKTSFYNHLDIGLEEDNDVSELDRDPAGHYLVAGEMDIPGTDKKIVRQLSEGQPQITAEALYALAEAGTITWDTYDSATKTVDVIDEEGLLEVLKSASVAAAIIPAIQEGKTHSSFWIKKATDKD